MDTIGPPKGVDDEDFISAMLHEDPLGIVVRSVIFIEHELIALAEEVATHPRAIKDMKLDYHGRVALAVTLGLVPSLQPALNALGSLRNKFAHNPGFSIGKEQVNALIETLDDSQRSAAEFSFERVRAAAPDQHSAKVDGLDPLDKLKLVALVLRQSVRAARMKVADK